MVGKFKADTERAKLKVENPCNLRRGGQAKNNETNFIVTK